MINELVQELRSYPASYTSAHRAADALENSEKNRLSMHYYACQLEDDLVKLEAAAESLREHIAQQQLDIVTLGQEVGRLRRIIYDLLDDGDETDRAAARAAIEEEKKG
jgi:hypothetical protein